MKLLRIASAYFESLPDGWRSWNFQLGDIVVSTIPIGKAPPVEDKVRLLLQASTDISFPKINDDGYILLPEDKRRELEAGLEDVVNLLAVFCGCRRSLSSAFPSAALVPDDDSQRNRLDSTKGFLIERTTKVSVRPQIPIESQLLQGLSDRRSGVALMAEALCHGLESGRFREYVRLFEAGFAMQFSQMGKKLTQFLNPGFGYTRNEVDAWIKIRDPLTHADGKQSDLILLDSDVRKVTQRMEQAAYDVLFNKERWHDPSRVRRNLWVPPAATTSIGGNLIIRQGSDPSLKLQLFDEFGIFPMDLQCVLTPPPATWWYKFPDKSNDQVNDAMQPTS